MDFIGKMFYSVDHKRIKSCLCLIKKIEDKISELDKYSGDSGYDVIGASNEEELEHRLRCVDKKLDKIINPHRGCFKEEPKNKKKNIVSVDMDSLVEWERKLDDMIKRKVNNIIFQRDTLNPLSEEDVVAIFINNNLKENISEETDNPNLDKMDSMPREEIIKYIDKNIRSVHETINQNNKLLNFSPSGYYANIANRRILEFLEEFKEGFNESINEAE